METFHINAVGTANLLESVDARNSPAVIAITSDKCYENREQDYAYNGPNRLRSSHDAYSMSKAAAELVAQSWNKAFFIPNPKLAQ